MHRAFTEMDYSLGSPTCVWSSRNRYAGTLWVFITYELLPWNLQNENKCPCLNNHDVVHWIFLAFHFSFFPLRLLFLSLDTQNTYRTCLYQLEENYETDENKRSIAITPSMRWKLTCRQKGSRVRWSMVCHVFVSTSRSYSWPLSSVRKKHLLPVTHVADTGLNV